LTFILIAYRHSLF